MERVMAVATGKRRRLLSQELAAAVKKLQGDHVLKGNFESEAAGQLCRTLEALFLLELKNDKGQLWREARRPDPLHPPQPSFWSFIDPMVSDEVKLQLLALRDSESDVMKCRSWLRLMLNKSLMVPFLEDLQRHPGLPSFHYGEQSLLRDSEQLEIIIQLLKGLTTIQLSYDYTNPGLTAWDTEVLQMVGMWSEPTSRHSNSEVERVIPSPGPEGLGQMMGDKESDSALSSNCSHGNQERGSNDFSCAVALDFEVVTGTTPPATPTSATLTSLLTRLVPEAGLDSQDYLCAACRRPIGVIFGQSKLCKYNGRHYCYDCHVDDERVIPARVVFNWDFHRHRVCRASCEFLDSISNTAVLSIDECNPALYRYIAEMDEAQTLRQQLNSLRDYLTTCKEVDTLEQFKIKLKSPHLYEELHSYSLQELCEVHSGVLLERMRKAIRIGKTHIKQCTLCSQKGFICEGCHGDNIIYPFDLQDTYKCQSCSTLYHLHCQPSKGNCSKCLRLHKRKAALVTDDI